MSTVAWPSIGFYCLFSVFVYYQQLHGRTFGGSSQAFGFVLALFGFLGMLTGFAYLGYYGWTVSFWGAFLAFIMGIGAIIPAAIVEKFVGKLTLSLAAFLVWPVAAYMMFRYIPT